MVAQVSDAGLAISRLLAASLGFFIIAGTLISAVQTFILPRGVNVWLTRIVFRFVGFFFRLRARRSATYEQRDQVMALFAPVTLLLMPLVLLTLVMIGYMCLYWALEIRPLSTIFKLSGSSLLTLGYASVDSFPSKILEFTEAMIGLILVALLIAYLPTMYAAFTRREVNVAMLEARAGSPPSAVEMIARSHRTGELERMDDFWRSWQVWFAELEESHTSLAPLTFFRSPQPGRSWVTAAGTVLDTAAFMLSTVDVPWTPHAAFCLRAGFLALREIAGFFEIEFDPDPSPDDVISISRGEFDEVCEELGRRGVPLKQDRGKAFADFAGWRVNYDTVLLALAALTMAPYAPWSSDRSVAPQWG